MEKLKIGQRIELYKILTDGTYPEGKMVPGTIRPGVDTAENKQLVCIRTNPAIDCPLSLSMFVGKEVKPIGAMIIKKVHKKLVRTL